MSSDSIGSEQGCCTEYMTLIPGRSWTCRIKEAARTAGKVERRPANSRGPLLLSVLNRAMMTRRGVVTPKRAMICRDEETGGSRQPSGENRDASAPELTTMLRGRAAAG